MSAILVPGSMKVYCTLGVSIFREFMSLMWGTSLFPCTVQYFNICNRYDFWYTTKLKTGIEYDTLIFSSPWSNLLTLYTYLRNGSFEKRGYIYLNFKAQTCQFPWNLILHHTSLMFHMKNKPTLTKFSSESLWKQHCGNNKQCASNTLLFLYLWA